MAVVTIQRLAEQIMNLIEGGDLGAGSSIGYNELKISIGQIINQMLKIDYFSVNLKMGEVIDNGTVLGLYEDIEVVSSNGKSQCTLPVKPRKLPRNMGVFGIYPKYTTSSNYEYDKEFIPLQMGQGGLIKSQPMINDLLGQVGYECFGDKVYFTKDIKQLFPDVVVAMRLAIMDVSQYDDYTMLPVPPEMEWAIVQEVYKLYSSQPAPSKVVDATVKEEQRMPIREQKQAE